MTDKVENTPETSVNTPKKPRKGGRGHRVLEPAKALQLRSKGYSLTDIGKKYGITPGSVHKSISKLRKVVLSPQELKEFREGETSFIDSVRAKLLVQMAQDKVVKDAKLGTLSLSYAQLTDKSMLLQGKATQNIDIRSMAVHFKDQADKLQDEIAALLGPQDVVDTPPEADPSASIDP